jgi:outer membrane protein OmpA-like peptidoglycan-associated protein
MKITRLSLAATLICVALGVHAQSKTDTTVLRGSAVTEDNLLDALTPNVAVKTRSLKAQRDAPPATKPSASLLITFETGSSVLTGKAKQQLDVVAGALKREQLAALTFNVEGHADPRGVAASNLSLSQQRAESVCAYLEQNGIDKSRLTPVGKGDTELINTDNPIAPENRRVTIVTNTN